MTHIFKEYVKIVKIYMVKFSKTTFNRPKQPMEVLFRKRCSKKFHKIHRKTPVPESLF